MKGLHHRTRSTIDDRGKLADFALWFDHTNLKPTAANNEILKLCEEAARYEFCAVCIAPRWVEFAAQTLSRLEGTAVQVCTVVGFPHGNTTTIQKAFETKEAISDGATEIDMVISVGDLKEGNYRYVAGDIGAVVDAAKSGGATVKVILETGYLETDQIVKGCELASKAGADFVKTSTGFGPAGANPEVVRLMRRTVGEALGVKAAGGIKSLSDARVMLEAGASRLGCSSSVAIIEQFRSESGY
jgi:deoxyribose-phosphate aldolase